MSSLVQTSSALQALDFTDRAFGDIPHLPYSVKPWQYRATVQPFSTGGFEVLVKIIDVEKVAHAVEAGLYGFTRCSRVESESKDREADLIKAAQRAKKMVRLKCKEMGANRLLTLTTRQTLSLPDLLDAWQRFVPMVERAMKGKFFYLAVPEPHPTNPDHLHLHVAINTFLPVRLIRKCWHGALIGGASGGDEMRGTQAGTPSLRGNNSPGNIDIQYIRVRNAGDARTKVARYISKYITKDCLQRFNKKRYWSSKDCTLMESRKIWLTANNMVGAYTEIVHHLGLSWGMNSASAEMWDGAISDPFALRPWISENWMVCWFNYVPLEGIDPHPPPF